MSLKTFSDTEPVTLTSIVTALIALAVSFGLSLDPEQIGAILAIVSIAGGILTRRKTYSAPVLDAMAEQQALGVHWS